MSTKIRRHPEDASLMSFAAGGLAEPLAAVVAAHLALCTRCRRELLALETIGGVLVGQLAPGAGPTAPPSRVMPAQERPSARTPSPSPANPVIARAALPAPIAARYGIAIETLRWRWLAPGVWHYPLPLSPHAGGDLRLVRIAPGRLLPEHGHGGNEMTLVLEGGFSDATGEFRRGDVQDADEDLEHQMHVHSDGCTCLLASERPARYRGWLARLMQPITGI